MYHLILLILFIVAVYLREKYYMALMATWEKK